MAIRTRVALAVATFSTLALATYACSDGTNPSQLPQYIPFDGSFDAALPIDAPAPIDSPASTPDASEGGTLPDSGTDAAHDASDGGAHDAGDSGVHDASDAG